MKILLDETEVPQGNDLLDILSGKLIVEDKSISKTIGSGLKPGDSKGRSQTDLEKKIIALDAISGNAPQREIARIHGVSEASVSSLLRGKSCGEGPVDEDLKATVDAARYGIQNLATAKLMSTLELFDPADLDNKDRPKAASSLAGVMEKMSSKDKEKGTNVQLIFHSPRQHKLDSYDVIEVG